MSECGAGCQGKEDNFRRNSSPKQRFTIPESSITLPESAPNFRDEFAVDSPLQRRVRANLDHLSPAQARAFMLADNRLAEIADWDDRLLAQQLKELSLLVLDFNIEDTGLEMGEIDLRISFGTINVTPL